MKGNVMVKEYIKTLKALSSLQGSLNCRVCHTLSKELFTLGGCEHKFCRNCCKTVGGSSCPVCRIPVHVKDVQIDRQLSNLVLLCLELRQILENDTHHEETELESTPKTQVTSNVSPSLPVSSPNLPTSLADVTNSPSLKNDNLKSCSPKASKRDTKLKSVYDFGSSPDTPRRHKVKGNAVKRRRSGLVTRQRCVNKSQTEAHDNDDVLSRSRTRLGSGEQRSVHPFKPESDKRHSLSPLNRAKTKKRSPVFSGSPLGRKRSVTLCTTTGTPTGSRMKRNAKGETPLHVAAIKGQTEVVENLLKEGANPNVRDNAGWTPLHEACNHGYVRTAELLLDHGAVVGPPGLDNDTPLHDAVGNHRTDCVALLVSRGASLTARNIHGLTPVDYAKTDAMKEALRTRVIKHDAVTQQVDQVDECKMLCFTATSMSRDQKIHLQKSASKLNAKVVEDLLPQVSHVITSCNDDGMCPRTLKYLHAILAGKWIVNITWLDLCIEYGKPMLEEAFEVAGSSTHPNSHAAFKGRMNRIQQLPGLFDGCQFYFHGSFVYPTPEKSELVALVKAGSGQVVTREPKLQNVADYSATVPYHAAADGPLAHCGLFVVRDNSAGPPASTSGRICVVAAQWIINSIATFTLLDPHS